MIYMKYIYKQVTFWRNHNADKPYHCCQCYKAFLNKVLNHAMRNHISSASVATKSQERKSLMGILDSKCSVVSLTKYFLEVMIRKSIWDRTLGRNHINVTSVTNLSLKELILKSISEHTLERSHLDAVSAIKHSQEMLNLKSTWGHTLGKSHINVTSVPNLSLT